MGVDDVGRPRLPEQLTYPLAVVGAQWLYANARKHAREVPLRTAITPDLTHNGRTRPQRRSLPLEHAQLGAQDAITTVNGDKRSGVEYRPHATSERGD
jgi:hypothetical protein